MSLPAAILHQKTLILPEEDHGFGLESGCKKNHGASTEYIESLPSKFPAQQPKNPTMMKHHNELLINEGYNSDNNPSYFDEVADVGDDLDQYYRDPIQLSGQFH